MLIYHPAFDAYHCLVRLSAILELIRTTELDRLRILDFCLCFPSVVADFKLPRDAMFLRGRGRSLANPYRTPIGAKRVFDDQEKIQEAALGCLMAAGLVQIDDAGTVSRTSAAMPEDLLTRCQRLRADERFFFEECVPTLQRMPLLGVGGLKERSKLLEYRYDAI